MAWGAMGQELEENYVIAERYYKSVLNDLENNEGPQADLMTKQAKWLAGYSDLKIRLGLIQDALNHDQEAKESLLTGYVYGAGSNILKSKAAIVLSRMASEEGLPDDAEGLLKDSVRFVVPESLAVKFDDPSWQPIVPENLQISDPQIEAFMALGKFYAQNKRDLPRALTIFLSTQRAIHNFRTSTDIKNARRRRDNYQDPKCLDAQLQSHISEVLWALGRRKDSITWAESAYYNAHLGSNTTVECGLCAKMSAQNLSKMYKTLGLESSAERFDHLANEQMVLPFNMTPSEKFNSLFW